MNKTLNRGWEFLLYFSNLLLPILLSAQPVAKISCLSPYEIQIAKGVSPDEVKRVVKYENHDDHTFWYKLVVAENGKFSYKVASTDQLENFDVFFYEYEGQNFCRSLIQNSLEMISFEKNVETKVSKGSVFYLGLYPHTAGGCGHQISLDFEGFLTILDVQNSKGNCAGITIVPTATPVDITNKIMVKGEVTDARTGGRVNARLTLTNPFSGQTKVIQSDENGFSVELEKDEDYKVIVQAFGYLDKTTAIPAYDGEFYKLAIETSNQKNFILQNVYFYPNTFALKQESEDELKSIYSFVVNHPEVSVEIIGHTNGDKDVKSSRIVKEIGEEWNFNGSARELSLRRAKKIKDYITARGVDEIRIEVTGKGGSEMIVQNPSDMKEAMKNIRVEIRLSTHN